MIRFAAMLAALCGLLLAAPLHAFDPARLSRMVESSDFAGVVLVSRGDTIHFYRAFGEVRPGSGEPHRLDARWRWASITKQVVATIAMQEVAAGNLDLDAPISRYWPRFPNAARGAITIRHLMQHLSGLPHPDDTQELPVGLPVFYTSAWARAAEADGYCAGRITAAPGRRYRYNNCDYIVLGAVLERITGETIEKLVEERISTSAAFYPAGTPTVPGYHYGAPEPAFALPNYGAAGAMNGTVLDLWHFDRALMRGELLDEATRAIMWDGNRQIGHAALGQWELPVNLAGCDAPVRLVERHGGIGGVHSRNFILPELDIAVIAFVNRSEAEFSFGHAWRGEGFAHDLLAEAACHWEEESTG